MAALGVGDKMKRNYNYKNNFKKKNCEVKMFSSISLFFLLLPIIILLLVIFPFVSAQEGDGSDVDWSDEETFHDNFVNDPAGAFQNNPELAWSTLMQDPSLLTYPEILDRSFAHDPVRAAAVVNQNPDQLLANDPVLTRFDLEIQQNLALLNNNDNAKKVWFKEKYRITDQGATVSAYDGRIMKTAGDKGTTFTPSHFPKALVKKDGSLLFEGNAFAFTQNLERTGDAYSIRGGVVQLRKDSKDLSVAATDVKDLAVVTQDSVGSYAVVSYEGTFHFTRDNTRDKTGDVVEGTFVRVLSTTEITGLEISGKIRNPQGSKPGEFIILGNAKLTSQQEKTTLEVKGNSQVYYTEEPLRTAGTFCSAGFSCIVNTPGIAADPANRYQARFMNIQHGDEITMKTPAYFSSVEFSEVQDGRVTFISSDKGKLAKINVGSGGKLSVEGDMNNLYIGRFDVLNDNHLQHWSSTANQHQSIVSYFAPGRAGTNSVVSCELGVNCMQRITDRFGKKVPPATTQPRTAIFVAGNNPETARDVEGFCQKSGGCFIVNARDSPLEMDKGIPAENVMLTGHHWLETGEERFWSDVPGTLPGYHHEKDPLYITSKEGASKVSVLPSSSTVRTFSTSGCNTVNPTVKNPLTEAITTSYPNIQLISGFYSKAQPVDHTWKDGPVTDVSEIKEFKWSFGGRATVIRSGTEQYWTPNGRICTPLQNIIISERGKLSVKSESALVDCGTLGS